MWDDVRVVTGETLATRFVVVDYLGPDGEGGQYLAYDVARQRNALIHVAPDLRTVELIGADGASTTATGSPRAFNPRAGQGGRQRIRTDLEASPFDVSDVSDVGSPARRIEGSGLRRLRRMLQEDEGAQLVPPPSRGSDVGDRPPDVDHLLDRLRLRVAGPEATGADERVLVVKRAPRKPAKRKPAERRPAERKAAERKAAERKPAERKPAERKPAARRAERHEMEASPPNQASPEAFAPTERLDADAVVSLAGASAELAFAPTERLDVEATVGAGSRLTPLPMPDLTGVEVDDEPTERLHGSRGRRLLQAGVLASVAGAVILLVAIPTPMSRSQAVAGSAAVPPPVRQSAARAGPSGRAVRARQKATAGRSRARASRARIGARASRRAKARRALVRKRSVGRQRRANRRWRRRSSRAVALRAKPARRRGGRRAGDAFLRNPYVSATQ